jgi:hypothetical protein
LVVADIQVGQLNTLLLEVLADFVNHTVAQISLSKVDFLQGAVWENRRPEVLVWHPFDLIVSQDKDFKLLVLGEGLSDGLDIKRDIRLEILEGEVADVAELVKLGKEELKVGGVFRATLRQIECVDLLVLHEDELNDLALDLTNDEASQL